MSELKSYRRYCLMKRYVANQAGENANAQIWQNKQEEQPGTDLPAGFPYLTELSGCGYTTKEDIDGADDFELYDVVGLNSQAAAAVFAALAEL